MSCPGSIVLSADIPNESSEYADEGTFAHDVAADALNYDLPAKHYLDNVSECGRFRVDAEMAAHIQTYLDVVRCLVDDAPITSATYVETKVRLFKDVWGTADAVVVSDDDWHIVDLKYGQGVLVNVEDNPQLMIYALAALSTLRHVHGTPKHIWLHVVQPRHSQGGHSSQCWNVKRLLNWKYEVLVPAVRRVRRGSKVMSAGDWCRFCPARQSCPEIHRASVEAAQSVFSDVPALREEISGPIKPEDLTPDQLGEVLKVLPTVETWIKSLRANALARLESGQTVPGYKLVRTSPHRRWTDEATALAELAKMHDYTELVALKSPAKVEKLLDKQHRKVVGSLVEKPEGKLSLALESDRRKAATPLLPFDPVDENVKNG
jgi:hypothetical protein